MKPWVILLMCLAGCADTTAVQRQPTQEDAPFGGGFESSRRPGGRDDPLDPNLRRGEVRTQYRRDNGAPEQRIDRGAPDARLDRRTQ